VILAAPTVGLGPFCLYVQRGFGLLHIRYKHIGDYGCGLVDDGLWHHVAVVQDGYDLRFHLDGRLLYTFDVPGGLAPLATDRLRIGCGLDGEDPLAGEVEQLRLLGRSLSETELREQMAAAPHANPEPPVSRVPPAPLYQDPLFNSAKDGTIVWNRREKNWWFLYMQIRNGIEQPGVSIHHGTTIGAASSPDGLRWTYRGTLDGLEFEPPVRKGQNTFWAPDIVWHAGRYQMIVTYVRGRDNPRWEGDRRLFRYASDDLMHWDLLGPVKGLDSLRILDAGIYRLPNGKWGIWYKDEVEPDGRKGTGCAESDDLLNFRYVSHLDPACHAVEGADVFRWQGYYWLLGDDCPRYRGLRIYRSTDCRHWERQANFMTERGTRPHDVGAAHAEVIVNGDAAYMFYWTSGREHVDPERFRFHQVARLQVARLEFSNGTLTCDRDREFELNLPEGES
jgi:hypothetical protein